MARDPDARAHVRPWPVRIEDVDGDRNVHAADRHIRASLQRCGMQWDGAVTWQCQRTALYEASLRQLEAAGAVYPCGCSRK